MNLKNPSEWGVPNWDDPDSYPCSLSGPQWAWQFLRRNEDYRKDWLNLQDLLTKHDIENCSTLDLDICNPPAIRGETREQWFIRVTKEHPNKTYNITPIETSLANKWGMRNFIADPINNDFPKGSLGGFKSPAGFSFFDHDEFEGPTQIPWVFNHCYEIAILLDLRYPLTDRLDAVKKFLKNTQKNRIKNGDFKARLKKPKYEIGLLRTYLQILDGLAVKATRNNMISTIFKNVSNRYNEGSPASDTYGKALKVAKHLRAEGYRDLVMLDTKSRGRTRGL